MSASDVEVNLELLITTFETTSPGKRQHINYPLTPL